MPICSVGDEHIGQSAAINFYVASENGLLGNNNLQAAQIIAVVEHVKEMLGVWRGLVPWGTDPSQETSDKWFDGGASDNSGPAVRGNDRYLTWWLGRIENALGSNGFAVGDKLSLADVALYNALGEYLRVEEAAEGTPASKREAFGDKARTDAKVAGFPKVAAAVNAVRNNANAQKWWDTRGVQGF
jgi:glutathione S-transferase